MALSNYNELKTSIASWLQRDDLTALIPDFINIAESYMNDDLRLRSMITEATITPSQVNAYVDLPDGFVEAISFNDENGEPLQQVHHEQLLDNDNNNSYLGSPVFYSVTSRINFESAASSALNYTMIYYKGLDLMTNSTNDVLTNHPNLYLFGSLIQAEMYLKNDKRIANWHVLYEKAMQKANSRSADSLVKLRSDHPSNNRGRFNINTGYY